MGLFVGMVLSGSLLWAGSNDFRSDQGKRLDYYRQKQESFDLNRMRLNSDVQTLRDRQDRINRAIGKAPC